MLCEADLRSSALRAPGQAIHAACAAADAGSRSLDLEALRRKRAEPPHTVRPSLRTPASPRLFYSPKATPEQLQLNNDIQACASADAVLDLVSSRRAVFSGVNAATALTCIQRLAGKQAAWLKDDVRFAQLLSTTESLLESMAPRTLATVLYAVGQCGITPPADWLKRYWDATLAKLSVFEPQGLSNTLYACGKLSLTPPASWLEIFWQASESKLTEFKPQGLSNTLYACGQLSLTPPGFWLEHFWQASAPRLSEFNEQNLSNTLFACAHLDT